jgi:FkbM family methyltransferase
MNLNEYIIKSTGVLHLGAHTGQEAGYYHSLNKSVVWVEAMPNIFKQLSENISQYQNQQAINALISDLDDQMYNFNVSNNWDGVSSSIFEFGDYGSGKNSLWPDLNLTMINQIQLTSTKLDSLFEKNNIDSRNYDFWVLDLQGAELLALKGADDSIEYCKTIYVEISQEEVYKNGVLYIELKNFLDTKGFYPIYEPKEIHDDVIFIRKIN